MTLHKKLCLIKYELFIHIHTGCPKKHGNWVTNWRSSLLWISIVIPNFKSHNIIMSARVHFMKRVKDCKDVSIMSPQDKQWRRTSLLCLYTAIFLFYYKYNCMQSKRKQTKCEHSRRNSYRLQLSQFTKSKNYLKRRYQIRHWIPMFIGTPCS